MRGDLTHQRRRLGRLVRRDGGAAQHRQVAVEPRAGHAAPALHRGYARPAGHRYLFHVTPHHLFPHRHSRTVLTARSYDAPGPGRLNPIAPRGHSCIPVTRFTCFIRVLTGTAANRTGNKRPTSAQECDAGAPPGRSAVGSPGGKRRTPGKPALGRRGIRLPDLQRFYAHPRATVAHPGAHGPCGLANTPSRAAGARCRAPREQTRRNITRTGVRARVEGDREGSGGNRRRRARGTAVNLTGGGREHRPHSASSSSSEIFEQSSKHDAIGDRAGNRVHGAPLCRIMAACPPTRTTPCRSGSTSTTATRPSDVVDALFLGRFATGEQPYSHSRQHRPRQAPAPTLLPPGARGAARRPRRRPQRHPRRGRRLDAAGLPLEPGRRRHGHRDQRRAGREGPGRRPPTARQDEPEPQPENVDHGLLVRLAAARPAPHHPADRGGHLGGDPAQLHGAGRRRDGPADEDHPRRHRGPAAAAARPAGHRQDLRAAHAGPLLARLVPGGLRPGPGAALHRRRLSDGHRDRRGRRHGEGPLAAAAPGGLRRADPRRGQAHRRARRCPGC